MLSRHVPVSSFLLAITIFVGALTNSLRARGPLDPIADAVATPAAVAVEQRAPAAGSFTGPGSCAATACHGAVRPVAGSRILQTEYTTWISQDRHARATEVLASPLSARMARILGLGSANASPKCLACHSLDVAGAQQARSFVDEGVSCESCHGPASGWLGPHTTKTWTHAQSVALGMYDTKDVVKRTERCLTCHLGTADKSVDHEMIAAGHPDLVFDLEAFSAAMPRHWRASAERDPFAPVRSFTVGQLVHLRSWLDRVARRAQGPGWPEYGELDCFACHHSLTPSGESWRQAAGYENRQPGSPPLNLARWVTARHVIAAVDRQAAAELSDVMAALAQEGGRLRTDTARVVEHAARARGILDRAIAGAIASKPDAAAGRQLFRAIAADAEAIAARGERAAEQAAMALETLYLAFAPRGHEPATRSSFDDLFKQFESPSSYDPRRFVAQVRRIEGALASSR